MPVILLLLAAPFVAKFFWLLAALGGAAVAGPADRRVVGAPRRPGAGAATPRRRAVRASGSATSVGDGR